METVRQLLDKKGHEVSSVHPHDSVFDAIKKMADAKIGALIVLVDDQIVGIVTERDYARNVILKGKSSRETPVRDIMTTGVVCARADQTIEECMAVMTEKRIRHLPVVDQERLVGLVSIRDLVKSIIADQTFTIEQLTHYIQG
ncbi:MAG: CBS domain-containing protein [Gammaproteobacteria bacterium]|jgi:CBS domain-containing protein|nr:CBS domain-containing protein [Gammaproteobacteria bacterium]